MGLEDTFGCPLCPPSVAGWIIIRRHISLDGKIEKKLRLAIDPLGQLGFTFAATTAMAGTNQLALAHRKRFVFVYDPFVVPAGAQGIALGLVLTLLLRCAF